jgi:hypothetical protein
MKPFLYQTENREVYDKLLAAKDEQIALLKNFLKKINRNFL